MTAQYNNRNPNCYGQYCTVHVCVGVKAHHLVIAIYVLHLQWAFGVTCWEIFTGGKIPYPAVDPMSLMKLLENGQRLEKPSNSACSRKM